MAGVYEEIPFEDVFDGVSQTLTVFNLVSDPSERLFMSTNRDDFDQSYKSFVIQANKRFSRNCTLNGAYNGNEDSHSPMGKSVSTPRTSGTRARPDLEGTRTH